MAQAPKTAVDIVFGAMTIGREGISVSWKSRVYRGFSCTASIIGNADKSPTS